MTTPYCEDEDLYLAFGEANVRKWGDVDNTDSAESIDARLLWARESATEWIDDRLRNGPYEIPFTAGSGEELPRSIVRMTAYLTGSILYEARGLIDMGDDKENSLRWAEKKVESWCRDIIARRIRLDLELVTTDYPFVVEDE